MSKSQQYIELYSKFWNLELDDQFLRSSSAHPTLYCPSRINVKELELISYNSPETITRIDHDSFFEKDRRHLEKMAYFISPEKLVMRYDFSPAFAKTYLKHFSIKKLNAIEWQMLFAHFSHTHDPEKQLDALFNNEQQTQLLAVQKDNETIGLAAAVQIDGKSFINSVIVAQEHRRKKAASRLMEVLLHSPFLPRTQQAWLEVYRENTPAVNLYLKCGFKIDHSFYLLKKYGDRKLETV